MHCVKLMGQCLVARGFERQVVEVQICIAALVGYAVLGILVTEAQGKVRLWKGGAPTGTRFSQQSRRSA